MSDKHKQGKLYDDDFVRLLYQKTDEAKTNREKVKRGRRRIHNDRDIRHILLDVMRDRFKPATSIALDYRGTIRTMQYRRFEKQTATTVETNSYETVLYKSDQWCPEEDAQSD